MQIKVWIESNSPSALPCYHVILKTSIIAAPTPSSWNVKRVRFRGTRCWCVLSNYACTLDSDWCHLPGDDDALIMRCCLKASFLLHTALPNETGELYRSMVYPCPNRSVYFFRGFARLMKVSHCPSGSSLVIAMTWRTARARILNVKFPM